MRILKTPITHTYPTEKEYTLNMDELKKAIDEALNADVDLSREEYAERCAKADEVTAAHGVEGEAPLTEEDRERRMRMNYYGSIINIGMNVLAALNEVCARLEIIDGKIGGVTDGSNDHAGSGK
jgi:hypothetical protein